MDTKKYFSSIKQDLPASVVVFLVALPLCMGIALGSGTPVIAGIIAGVIGGIVVGFIGNSNLSVSGPAAGLIATVSVGIETVGSLEALYAAVIVAGVIQIILGLVKAGIIGGLIPNSVINGMLVAIGILLILKQLPHLVGYDADFEGDESFLQKDGHNTVTELFYALKNVSLIATILGVSGILLQIFWDRLPVNLQFLKKWLPGPLVVVIFGALVNYIVGLYNPSVGLRSEHLVNVPLFDDIISGWKRPELTQMLSPKVLMLGLSIGVIASIESLLSIEAADKLDPSKHITSTNRELLAQGCANITSGFLGGLPVTSVIVRSSANVNAGAKTKVSAIMHGLLLALFVLLFPRLLGLIPLASLAAILIYVGFKLAKPAIFKSHILKGKEVYIPFLATIMAILATDLLKGVLVGLILGLFFAMRASLKKTVNTVNIDDNYMIQFIGPVSFLNKSIIKQFVEELPDESNVVLDFSRCSSIDADIQELLSDFYAGALEKNNKIELKFLNSQQHNKLFNQYNLILTNEGAH
jgi:MFS superfamily sulfate permease-like transporter